MTTPLLLLVGSLAQESDRNPLSVERHPVQVGGIIAGKDKCRNYFVVALSLNK